MSQEALALEADLQRHYISLLEHGVNSPSLKTIFKLAAALDVSPDNLMALVVSEAATKRTPKSSR